MDENAPSLAKFEAVLAPLPEGSLVAVVTMRGSLCPVTLGHMQSFAEARRLLHAEPGVPRPARLEKFAATLGFISLNGDRHVNWKLEEKGEQSLSWATRWHLVELATADISWMSLETFEGESMEELKRLWSKLTFIHFYMNGADDVVAYNKYTWASSDARYITMGRPGFTEQVLEGMAHHGLDADEGKFILGPELPEISSTQARRALAEGDTETLRLLLHPRVTQWCLRHSPYVPSADEAQLASTADDGKRAEQT